VKWLFFATACVAWVATAVAPAHAEEPEDRREVPEDLVPVLNAAQRALEADDPQAAVRILDSYEGDPDPLQQLLAGYARMDLDQPAEAESVFRSALELDDALEQARTGLARALVAQEKWKGAIEILRKTVDVERSDALELGLYARCALEAGDLRLASLLAERGLLRFPEDITLRRIDVEVLVRREAWSRALEAALGLLSRAPRDELGWRQLAVAADRAAPELAVAALEGAMLVAPENQGIALRFARRLYDSGDYVMVLELARRRLASGAGEATEDWRRMGLSAAVRANDWKAAARWSATSGSGSDDLAQLVTAHQRLDEGKIDAALELFAEVSSRRRIDSDQLWSLVERAETARRPGLRTYFARATLARCDAWAPAAAAVLATQSERDLDPDVLLEASCGS